MSAFAEKFFRRSKLSPKFSLQQNGITVVTAVAIL